MIKYPRPPKGQKGCIPLREIRKAVQKVANRDIVPKH